MAPAARWIIGIVLALVATGLWMFWNSTHRPQAPAQDKANAQGSATAQNPATAEKQALSNVDTALQPIMPKSELAPSSATGAAKADEAVTAVVYFDFDRSGLRSGETPKLDELAARIKGRSFHRLDAVGRADRIGEEPYNDQLSRKRADAVVAYLVAQGLDAGRLRAVAKGESESTIGDACNNMGPDSGKNEKLVACLQRDRYVEIVLR